MNPESNVTQATLNQLLEPFGLRLSVLLLGKQEEKLLGVVFGYSLSMGKKVEGWVQMLVEFDVKPTGLIPLSLLD